MHFTVTLSPRWSDLDPNNHLRHSAYADFGAQARLAWFEKLGFTAHDFMQLGIGPILFREELHYLREIRLGERVQITVERTHISEDGRKWGILHNFSKADGTPAAVVWVDGAWIDIRARKLAAPPEAVIQAFRELPEGVPQSRT